MEKYSGLGSTIVVFGLCIALGGAIHDGKSDPAADRMRLAQNPSVSSADERQIDRFRYDNTRVGFYTRGCLAGTVYDPSYSQPHTSDDGIDLAPKISSEGGALIVDPTGRGRTLVLVGFDDYDLPLQPANNTSAEILESIGDTPCDTKKVAKKGWLRPILDKWHNS